MYILGRTLAVCAALLVILGIAAAAQLGIREGRISDQASAQGDSDAVITAIFHGSTGTAP